MVNIGRAGRRSVAGVAALCGAILLVTLRVALSDGFTFAVVSTSQGQPVRAPVSSRGGLVGAATWGEQPGVAALQPRGTVATALVALAAAGAAAALIVQNKGGGHGELGYHLARRLAGRMKVTLINDSAARKEQPPFGSYFDLEAKGVDVRWADLANGGLTGALEGVAPCDYVFDNQNVCPQEVQSAVAAWKPKVYAYVSSGGMYKPRRDKPLIEVGDIKEDNKQRNVELNAAALGLNWCAFRPQYIYGPKTNKRDYIDWFLDRIVRNLPVLLPVDGSLTTTVTHADDVAGMMASVVGKEAQAKGQIFNCATDVRISHQALAEMIGSTVGKKPRLMFYDPEKLKGVKLPKKGKFPFRETHFGVGVEKAKIILKWKPQHRLQEDLVWYCQEYMSLGKDRGEVAMEWDQAVTSAMGLAAGATGRTQPSSARDARFRLAALIVQNKGGGHGEIGYHLALKLASRMQVTMVVDSAAKRDKPPFDSYSDLEAAGVDIRWADLANGGFLNALAGVSPCDYVFDNQNVCPKDVQLAVAPWAPKAYVYVSSGGMYKPREDGPLIEVGEVKEDNKQLSIERSAAALGLNWCAFRPQYIYGPKTNKRDYIDWFLDRIVRDLPVPLPADGSLTTTLTHAADVAGMLASVVGKEAQAKGQVFNCATDARISHKELAELVGSAVGKMPQIVYYDPAEVKNPGKFPFRETHFAVLVEKAKILLGWKPEHSLKEDLASYYAEYQRLHKDEGDYARRWEEAVYTSQRIAPPAPTPPKAATPVSAAPAPGAALGAGSTPPTRREPAVLIVQNKGGGHGEIGYHLALKLARRLKVTIITDSAAKRDAPPFDSYGDLEAAGVQVRWANLAQGGLANALEGIPPCDFVFDNQNVCPLDVQKAVAPWAPKAYAYVSSGGMYKPREDKPLIEVGDVKEDNKQLSIERSAAAMGLCWSAYRPQYIYGPKTNKRDYIDWFLDRIVRDLPVPLPVDGSLTTTLTHAADVAGMLATVVDKAPQAKGQVFNCATDVRISHKALTGMIGGIVGKKPNIVFYDPGRLKGIEVPKKGKFPFRETHFGVAVAKAKIILAWKPQHDLEKDLQWYYAEYKRLGKDQGAIPLEWDTVVMQQAMATSMGA